MSRIEKHQVMEARRFGLEPPHLWTENGWFWAFVLLGGIVSLAVVMPEDEDAPMSVGRRLAQFLPLVWGFGWIVSAFVHDERSRDTLLSELDRRKTTALAERTKQDQIEEARQAKLTKAERLEMARTTLERSVADAHSEFRQVRDEVAPPSPKNLAEKLDSIADSVRARRLARHRHELSDVDRKWLNDYETRS